MIEPRFSRLLCLAAFASCGGKSELPVFNAVPPFQLTAQSGLPFDSATLRGTPWIASFFFTSCAGPCPRLNTALHTLQEQTYQFRGLRIVSFTVDPAQDTPDVLSTYARRYKADPDRWVFLTGAIEKIGFLAKEGFQVDAPDADRAHSTRAMLVDREGRVRGHFRTDDDEDFRKLMDAIKTLYR